MFRADLAWAGPLIGVAAVAIRIYLRGVKMAPKEVQDARLVLVRDQIWELRQDYLDSILLHTCGAGEYAQAMLWLVGWEVDVFVVAALANRRGDLDD